MASDIQTVRTLIGDRTKAATNEFIGEGDGVNTTFPLILESITKNELLYIVV